ncbi:septum formation protein Maf [Frankia sp. CNm7]|uniref:dTTP/UTP pyrophosphatase n=1 Tax=Frankia nepalensis TaxID=1836974 RepID=A0A937RH99_9ACTN|nr:Maf family protein [Frankia nepalensis]MBL7495449.1 septum formation protein Maf [Frankia nepalensis]MBL7510721.1 septum formation protein Maf [Frankia nepalensis]MBL7521684.1 septum formation protein Maf [Frankia nepalensis]MBL7626006.1 septum formation protein Maf [Frankia nepalensis]
MPARRIVLASGSPRRRELLAAMGVPFDVLVSEVDEAVDEHNGPHDVALRLARRKARAVAGRVPDGLVIGGDTVVELAGRIYGKPGDALEAAAMLGELAGRAHQVVTGLAVVDAASGELREAATTSVVRMRPLGADEIREYVASGEPFDKAGAYAIQGLGRRLVTSVAGDLDNVIGLPTATLRRLLAHFGVSLPAPAGQEEARG